MGGGPISLSVSSSPNPTNPNEPVTVTATIGSQGCNAGLAPTGVVTLKIGATTQDAAIRVVNSYDAQGTASFQTTLATGGSFPVSASYAGGNGCSAANATGPNHIVRQPTTPTPVVTTPANGAFVSTATPTYQGTAPANSTVTVYVDGVSIGTTTASQAGSFSLTQPASLTAASHTVAATAQAVGASVSPFSSTNTFVIITLSPTANSQSVTAGFQTATAITLTGNDPNSPARPLTYSVTAAPTGGTLSGTAPNLTYTPSVGFSGSDSFTFSASNGVATSTPATISITVTSPTISVFPAALPNAMIGSAYSQSLDASGGNAPYTFTLSAGALPTGLTLTSNGVLSGTPRSGGSFNFSVTATDASGSSGPYSGSRSYTMTVEAPTIVVAPASLANATRNVAYSQTLTAFGGTAPHSFAVTAGSLPNGLTLALNGALSGTPTVAGQFTFTATATDSSTGTGPYSGSRSYTLNVAAPTITLAPNALPDGTVAQAYSQTITAAGGTAPYTYAATSGALPAGVTLTTAGTISGTPTSGGAFSFDVTATDANGNPGVQSYTFRIGAPTLAIAPLSVPDATTRIAYSQTLTASGGTAPYSFAVTAGALPAGLTLSTGGALSGTTTAAGSYAFSVTATESSTGSGPYSTTASYTLIVAEPTIVVAPATVGPASAGIDYSQTLKATGGAAPYTFSVTSGALPSGITLSSAGTLSGSTRQSGSFTFTATATDSNGNGGERQYTLAVSSPAIALTPTTLPSAPGSTAYSQTLTASNGFAPYTYAVTAGTLPKGLALAADGTLSGVPTVSGNFNFTVTATDNASFTGSQAYTLTVVAPGIAMSPSSLPKAAVAVAFSQTLSASGGAAPYAFAVSSGALPTGVTLAADGKLSGTPTVAGSFSLMVTVTDANGFAGTQTFTLDVSAPAIVLAPGSLPAATGSAAYAEMISASGGLGDYTFKVTSGTLPTGLSLALDGALSGVPTVAGSFNFTVTATDSGTYTGSQAYTLAVLAPGIALSPSSLPKAVVAVSFSQTLSATGGAAPYAFAVSSGALPAGVTLAADGTLSGTPTEAGSFPLTAAATDANGFVGTQAFTLDVAAPTIVVAPGSLPAATGSTPYAQTISASGGLTPYSFTVTGGALPSGLTLGASGSLSGTPTVSGSFAFTVTATDRGNFTATQAYTLQVDAPEISITPASLSNATAGNAYAVTFAASGGAAPYSFAVSGSTLPPGLALDTEGRLSGTPQTGGSFAFTIKATDANGFAGTEDVSLTVDGEIPVAQDQSAGLLAGTTTTVRLTEGARGGPFTNATLVSVSDSSLGTARIVRSGADYDLVFAAGADASGQTVATYTLSNQFATSAPATVTFMVTARPDPSKDAEVIGLVSAQVESTQRMARAQIRNFRDRLEQTHDEETRLQGSFGITLGGGQTNDNRPLSYYAEEERRGTDPATLAVLGYANDSKPIALPSESQARRRFGNAALWTGGFINFGSRDNDGIELDQTLVGISAGVDYRFSSQFVGGVGFGVGRDKSEIGDRGSETSARAYSGALYGSYSPLANIYVDGVLGYGKLSFDTRRAVTDQNLQARGERSGEQVFGSLTLAYEHKKNGWLVSPYAGYEGSRSNLDAYSENGAGIFNLRFGEQQVTTSSALIGLRLEKEISRPWGTLTPKGRIEYSHDFDGSSRVDLGYADLGDNLPYSLDADVFSKDNITLGLGIDAQFATGWGLGLNYNTEFGTNGNAQDHRIEAKVSKQF
ncbi:putative Ig domain-containing protein [Tianweitania sp. BSSL-BM11]|uniref:Ig domain-containing protein n=1 Tax=Tianweitania aestuarii TaxID=2814886 RepID=A0ABS5RYP2_9HYPH|nr:putative Ig domain-containing protein [Tianweitania aestuarii]